MKTSGTHRYVALFAAVALLLSACEEKNGTTVPQFPEEVVTCTVSSGEEVVVSFNANTAWQLSSDALWCKVDGMFLDTSGKAGEQSVKFVVSADGQSVDESQANITLRMGDESKVIAVITRSGVTDAIVMGSDSIVYEHNQALTIGTSGVHTMVIRRTTFDINNLYITNNADWLSIDRADTVITLTVKDEYLKYSQHNTADSICFSDKDTPMLRLNVQYTGMDARSVIMSPATQWALTVAADGKTYKDGMYSTTLEVYETPIPVMLTARNDAYELIYVNYEKDAGCTIVNAEESWISVADDQQGGISISFSENTANKRKGYLFVLPQFLADSIADGKDAFLFEELEGAKEIKADAERYLIAEFTQESLMGSSFAISHGTTLQEVEVSAESDSEWLDIAMGYCVSEENVYHTQLEFGAPYVVNPMLDIEAWDPGVVDGAHIQVWGKSGKQYLINDGFRAEPSLAEDDLHYYILLQTYVEEEHIIYFVDANKIPLKALVVEPVF